MIQLDERIGAEPKFIETPEDIKKRKKKLDKGAVEDGAEKNDDKAHTNSEEEKDV